MRSYARVIARVKRYLREKPRGITWLDERAFTRNICRMEHDPILAEITAFIEANGMAESTFGRDAIGDWRLLTELRAGREPRRATAAKIRDFMASYRAKTAA